MLFKDFITESLKFLPETYVDFFKNFFRVKIVNRFKSILLCFLTTFSLIIISGLLLELLRAMIIPSDFAIEQEDQENTEIEKDLESLDFLDITDELVY